MDVLSNKNNIYQNNDTHIVFANLEPTKKILLTDYDDAKSSTTWCCNSKLGRNCVRVFITGIFSFAGPIFAGLVPRTGPLVVGGLLSGIGNGLSALFSREKEMSYLIKKRLINDFPKVVTKLTHLNERTTSLFKILKLPLNSHETNILIEDLEHIVHESSILEKQEKLFFVWRTINRRNAIRLLAAGILPAVGGLLGGFLPTVGGVIGGGILCGIGNGLSTALTYELNHEALIKRRAVKELPKLLKIIQQKEEELVALIQRINDLKPDLLINYMPNISPPIFLDGDEDESICALYGMRSLRNLTGVNVSCWLSTGGLWVSTFYSKIPGVIVGSSMGAFANMISTWFSWEDIVDRKIEKVGKDNFQKMALKVMEVSYHISSLKTYIEKLEGEIIAIKSEVDNFKDASQETT